MLIGCPHGCNRQTAYKDLGLERIQWLQRPLILLRELAIRSKENTRNYRTCVKLRPETLRAH